RSRHTGRTRRTPAPQRLSRPGSPRSTASLASARFSSRGDSWPPSSCRTTAATPAADGAAADVPKNRQTPFAVAGQTFGSGKPPDPLIETPSAAVHVGATAVRKLVPGTPVHGPT